MDSHPSSDLFFNYTFNLKRCIRLYNYNILNFNDILKRVCDKEIESKMFIMVREHSTPLFSKFHEYQFNTSENSTFHSSCKPSQLGYSLNSFFGNPSNNFRHRVTLCILYYYLHGFFVKGHHPLIRLETRWLNP